MRLDGASVDILAAGELLISQFSHVLLAAWILPVPSSCSAG